MHACIMFWCYRDKYADGEKWPADSPVAGKYDVENSPTKMVLLNNRRPKVGPFVDENK